jgi:hypothetical protein
MADRLADRCGCSRVSAGADLPYLGVDVMSQRESMSLPEALVLSDGLTAAGGNLVVEALTVLSREVRHLNRRLEATTTRLCRAEEDLAQVGKLLKKEGAK